MFNKQKLLPAVPRKKNMIELLTQLLSFYVNKIRAKIWDRKSRTENSIKNICFWGYLNGVHLKIFVKMSVIDGKDESALENFDIKDDKEVKTTIFTLDFNWKKHNFIFSG